MPKRTPNQCSGRRRIGNRKRPNYAAINRGALPHLAALCARWLSGGRRIGAEWVCGSLHGEPGASCKVNLRTGRWADFATGDRGGDPVSLAAAVHRLTQAEAARRLARMLGFEAGRYAHD
jgi:putative DNA primase/helicase